MALIQLDNMGSFKATGAALAVPPHLSVFLRLPRYYGGRPSTRYLLTLLCSTPLHPPSPHRPVAIRKRTRSSVSGCHRKCYEQFFRDDYISLLDQLGAHVSVFSNPFDSLFRSLSSAEVNMNLPRFAYLRDWDFFFWIVKELSPN